ncbi:MAG: DM13 domain-containing protein [Minisyncoccia bacterium]
MKYVYSVIVGLLILCVTLYALLKLNGSRDEASVALPQESYATPAPVNTEAEYEMLGSGAFNMIDRLHKGQGLAVFVKSGDEYMLAFNDDFSVVSGPDLYVYLSEPQEYTNSALGGINTKKTLLLAPLKSTSGAQAYRITKEQYEKYGDAVIIWCKEYGIQFSRAEF